MNHGQIDASEKLETLLNGEAFTQEIRDEITYDHLMDSEKNFWSVLLMTGYVTRADLTGGNAGMVRRAADYCGPKVASGKQS